MVELKEYFPMWEKLTAAQRARLLAASDKRHFERGKSSIMG